MSLPQGIDLQEQTAPAWVSHRVTSFASKHGPEGHRSCQMSSPVQVYTCVYLCALGLWVPGCQYLGEWGDKALISIQTVRPAPGEMCIIQIQTLYLHNVPTCFSVMHLQPAQPRRGTGCCFYLHECSVFCLCSSVWLARGIHMCIKYMQLSMCLLRKCAQSCCWSWISLGFSLTQFSNPSNYMTLARGCQNYKHFQCDPSLKPHL